MSSFIIHHLLKNIANGFNNAASFDGAARNARQQRSERKIVTRRHHLNLISRIVEILQEASSRPTSSQHHHLFLLRNRHFRSTSITVSQKATTTASTNSCPSYTYMLDLHLRNAFSFSCTAIAKLFS